MGFIDSIYAQHESEPESAADKKARKIKKSGVKTGIKGMLVTERLLGVKRGKGAWPEPAELQDKDKDKILGRALKNLKIMFNYEPGPDNEMQDIESKAKITAQRIRDEKKLKKAIADAKKLLADMKTRR